VFAPRGNFDWGGNTPFNNGPAKVNSYFGAKMMISRNLHIWVSPISAKIIRGKSNGNCSKPAVASGYQTCVKGPAMKIKGTTKGLLQLRRPMSRLDKVSCNLESIWKLMLRLKRRGEFTLFETEQPDEFTDIPIDWLKDKISCHFDITFDEPQLLRFTEYLNECRIEFFNLERPRKKYDRSNDPEGFDPEEITNESFGETGFGLYEGPGFSDEFISNRVSDLIRSLEFIEVREPTKAEVLVRRLRGLIGLLDLKQSKGWYSYRVDDHVGVGLGSMPSHPFGDRRLDVYDGTLPSDVYILACVERACEGQIHNNESSNDAKYEIGIGETGDHGLVVGCPQNEEVRLGGSGSDCACTKQKVIVGERDQDMVEANIDQIQGETDAPSLVSALTNYDRFKAVLVDRVRESIGMYLYFAKMILGRSDQEGAGTGSFSCLFLKGASDSEIGKFDLDGEDERSGGIALKKLRRGMDVSIGDDHSCPLAGNGQVLGGFLKRAPLALGGSDTSCLCVPRLNVRKHSSWTGSMSIGREIKKMSNVVMIENSKNVSTPASLQREKCGMLRQPNKVFASRQCRFLGSPSYLRMENASEVREGRRGLYVCQFGHFMACQVVQFMHMQVTPVVSQFLYMK
jgi:hypothetical protein